MSTTTVEVLGVALFAAAPTPTVGSNNERVGRAPHRSEEPRPNMAASASTMRTTPVTLMNAASARMPWPPSLANICAVPQPTRQLNQPHGCHCSPKMSGGTLRLIITRVALTCYVMVARNGCRSLVTLWPHAMGWLVLFCQPRPRS
eukprot:7343210-Pyramimonas_sp.AAC.1